MKFTTIKFLLTVLIYISIAYSVDKSALQFEDEYQIEKIGKDANLEEVEKLLFLAFEDNYKDIAPDNLKDSFQSFKDVQLWLKDTFKEELNQFRSQANISLIGVKRKKENAVLVGLLICELVGSDLHLRQMAVHPQYQRRGIGKHLLSYTKDLYHNPKVIFADTRKINIKACEFYKKLGFEICNVHDKSLDEKFYCGFQFKLHYQK